MSPRAGLTRNRIAAAGLVLLRDSPDTALTMRRVATHFSVDPMALYRHVRDKDDLLQAMSDLTLKEGLAEALNRTTGEGPRGVALATARALYQHLVQHPERIPIVAASPTTTTAAAYSLDIAARLVQAGTDETTAVRCIRAVVAYVLGTALLSLEPTDHDITVDIDSIVADLTSRGAVTDIDAMQRMLTVGLQPDFDTGLRAIVDAFLNP